MIFAFLYGLSMDYEVFMLTRMREAYDETGDTTQAISLGLARTGKLVTSAALVLMFAFFVLSTSPGTDIKQFGIGLAAGIIFDATVIRALLVPSIMRLMGELELVDAPRRLATDPPRRSRAPPESTANPGATACERCACRARELRRRRLRPRRRARQRRGVAAALVERLGFDWEYLEWLAVDASATVLGEHAEGRGAVVSYGGEAFTAGFLIGVHLREELRLEAALLAAAVDAVQERGRHAVIADHCDLASVARLETVYSDALVESMAVAEEEREAAALAGDAHLRGRPGRRAGARVRRRRRARPGAALAAPSTRSSSSASGANSAAGQTNMSSLSSRPSRWPCSQGSRDRVSTVCA